MRWKLSTIIFMIAACLTGCNLMQYGTEDLPESKHISQTTEVDKKVESIIEQKAKEQHVAPELSDDFVSRYLDMKSFDELKRRTEEGISATNKEADMTKKEVILWQDLIKNKMVQQYTTDDLEANKKMLTDALEKKAEEHHMTMQEFMNKIYGMNNSETTAFIEKQAEKFTTADIENVPNKESENLEN